MKFKKFLAIILAVLSLMTCSVVAVSAASTAASNSAITVKVNGKVIAFPKQAPVIKNDRTLVPIRFVAEALGYDKEERDQVKDMLFTAYPTKYSEVYNIMMKTICGEIWETLYEETSELYPLFSCVAPRSGTFDTIYYDGREVEIPDAHGACLPRR